MSTKPIQLTDSAFAETILKAKLPAFVELWSNGCRPCIPFSAIIEQIAGEFAGRIVVAQANLEDCPGIAATFSNVAGVPAMLFLHRGKMIKFAFGPNTFAAVKADCDWFLSFCAGSDAAQDAFEKTVQAAFEKRNARIAAASAVMDAAQGKSPEMQATKAAFAPLDAAAEKMLAREKAQLDAGEITPEMYKALHRSASNKIANNPPPELVECLEAINAAVRISMEALDGDLKIYQQARREAEDEYNAAVAEAARGLEAATSTS